MHFIVVVDYSLGFIFSVQDTLAEATALLVGLESPDQDDTMDVDEDVTDKHSSGEDSPEEGGKPQDLSYEGAVDFYKPTDTFAKPALVKPRTSKDCEKVEERMEKYIFSRRRM